MQADTRQQQILDILMRRGYAAIEELAAVFGVTPQTIRRDMHELAGRGLLKRHHGGASVMSSTANTDYDSRHVEYVAEKKRMAAAAVKLIHPGASIFMTPGTTMEAMATAIADSNLTGLRVITNSTVAARLLARNPHIAIHCTGGFWQANNHALGGSVAAEIAGRYRCDLLFTSIGGIDGDGWLLEFREEEVVVAKAMLANARRKILLADHTKFTRVASCKLARIGEMTALITDAAPPARLRQSIEESGCELIVAGEL